eukprot:EC713111.1.p2 GENE.EC713111.1~~EC713111.1.p2  ORF type:complete len:67 (-),score=3.39 EC713111.1:56-256(-)
MKEAALLSVSRASASLLFTRFERCVTPDSAPCVTVLTTVVLCFFRLGFPVARTLSSAASESLALGS